MRIKDGRKRTLPGVLHIPGLEINIIYVSTMSDAGVHIVFEKDSTKMVQGAMGLMRGFGTRTLYKLLGCVEWTGCISIDVPDIDWSKVDLIVIELTVPHLVDPTMLWHQSMGHIGEKGL
jgi:hypothetical protein